MSQSVLPQPVLPGLLQQTASVLFEIKVNMLAFMEVKTSPLFSWVF